MALDDRVTNELLKRLVFLANTRGIIPSPVTATRVYISGAAVGVATGVVYTVPDGKVLFINSSNLVSRESAAASSSCLLGVRNGSDNYVHSILSHAYDVAGHQTSHQSFLPAIEVPEKYDVYIQSWHANIDAYGDIFGWIEDA